MKGIPLLCICVCLIASLLPSCTSLEMKSTFNKNRTFPRSKKTVYAAVLKYCQENGYEIESSDPEAGIIRTKFRQNELDFKGRGKSLLFMLVEQSAYQVRLDIEFKYTINLLPSAQTTDAGRVFEGIRASMGTEDIEGYLADKYSGEKDDAIIVFDFSSDAVKEWDARISINGSPEKELRRKPGELYEVKVPEGTAQIRYQLISRLVKQGNGLTVYQSGNSSIGLTDHKTLDLPVKKGETSKLRITEVGRGDSCTCLAIPFLILLHAHQLDLELGDKYVDVAFKAE
ncbi:MAG: hypothetical protein EPN93_07675 [Spirochaetes bacterium]|nr:MAG: hypothetical protein EPN93_07675 [Spirochaetota bacterium]